MSNVTSLSDRKNKKFLGDFQKQEEFIGLNQILQELKYQEMLMLMKVNIQNL